MQANQRQIHSFIQRIKPVQMLGCLKCGAVITLRFSDMHQFLAGGVIILLPVFALRYNPIIVAAWQQVSLIG